MTGRHRVYARTEQNRTQHKFEISRILVPDKAWSVVLDIINVPLKMSSASYAIFHKVNKGLFKALWGKFNILTILY